MKAVLFPGDSVTSFTDIPKPEPGPDEVVVRLTRSGVCGTDVHYWVESSEVRADRANVVPGHESVGVVDAVGSGVSHLTVGDRVVIGLLHIGCGYCRVCRLGEYGLCPDKVVIGRDLDGSYAEFARAPERAVYRLDDGLPDDVAVLVACNLSTAWSALRRAEVGPGDTVAVFGLGGVGLSALLVAQSWGASVIGIDPIESRRETAEGFGAKTYDPTEVEAAAADGSLTAGVVMECSAHPAAQAQSLLVVEPGGTVVAVGIGGRFDFGAEVIIRKVLTIIGTLVCRPAEFFEVLDFAANHVGQLRALLGPTITIEDTEVGLRHAREGGEGKVLFDWTRS